MPPRSSPTPPAVRRAIRDVGTHLSDWRRLQDLTAEQIADRAGIAPGTVHRIEAGKGASLENILRVARALGIADPVVAAFDPWTTNSGRARVRDLLPQRPSGRGALPAPTHDRSSDHRRNAK